jgi:hypothetical protein
MQLVCHPVAVVTLHINKTKLATTKFRREGYMRSI